MHWLHVGSLAGRIETVIDGYVWQADTTGIKAAWGADDHQSGITKFKVAVGTTHGQCSFYKINHLFNLVVVFLPP